MTSFHCHLEVNVKVDIFIVKSYWIIQNALNIQYKLVVLLETFYIFHMTFNKFPDTSLQEKQKLSTNNETIDEMICQGVLGHTLES